MILHHGLARERNAAQTARTELARAEMRLEARSRLEGEIEPLPKVVVAERARGGDAQQAAEVHSVRLKETRVRQDPVEVFERREPTL